MKRNYSPADVITILGGFLSFIGLIAFFTESVNLSVPTFFYGVPIFLIGLALKTSEIPPVNLLNKDFFNDDNFKRPEELTNLVKDVTKWRYGIQAHLETSLQNLKLWDDENPPQLIELEEVEKEEKKGLRMHFKQNAVPIEKWFAKQDRLNRFFAKGLVSEIIIHDNKKEFDLILFYQISID